MTNDTVFLDRDALKRCRRLKWPKKVDFSTMAEAAGLTPQRFSDWITEGHEPNDSSLRQLVDYLHEKVGASLDDIRRPAKHQLPALLKDLRLISKEPFWSELRLRSPNDESFDEHTGELVLAMAQQLRRMKDELDTRTREAAADRAFVNVGRIGAHLERIETLAESERVALEEIRDRSDSVAGIVKGHSDRIVRIRHLRTLAQDRGFTVEFSDDLQARYLKSFLYRPHAASIATLYVSSGLPPGAVRFEIAKHIGHHRVSAGEAESLREEFIAAPGDTRTEESSAAREIVEREARERLASSFAAALLLPRQSFLQDVKRLRFDIEALNRLYRSSTETVVRRIVSLSMLPQATLPEELRLQPMHFLKTDEAGNLIGKLHGEEYDIIFPRTLGSCAKWGSVRAFRNPTEVTRQWSEFLPEPRGTGEPQKFFCVSFVVNTDQVRYGQSSGSYAITLGCRAKDARDMIYADGFIEPSVLVGKACSICTRDCNQRALPYSHAQSPSVRDVFFARKYRSCSPLTPEDVRQIGAIVGRSKAPVRRSTDRRSNGRRTKRARNIGQ